MVHPVHAEHPEHPEVKPEPPKVPNKTPTEEANGKGKEPSTKEPHSLPSPPALPSLPTLENIQLPTSLNQYPAAIQTGIKNYIKEKYPHATTEQEIEDVLITLVKAVGTYYLGDIKIIALLTKVIDNANAAREVGNIAWKLLPASKQHQVYGALAKYYKEIEDLVGKVLASEQKVLDEYSVLFSQPQLNSKQLDIEAFKKIEQVCQEFENTSSVDGA